MGGGTRTPALAAEDKVPRPARRESPGCWWGWGLLDEVRAGRPLLLAASTSGGLRMILECRRESWKGGQPRSFIINLHF